MFSILVYVDKFTIFRGFYNIYHLNKSERILSVVQIYHKIYLNWIQIE